MCKLRHKLVYALVSNGLSRRGLISEISKALEPVADSMNYLLEVSERLRYWEFYK